MALISLANYVRSVPIEEINGFLHGTKFYSRQPLKEWRLDSLPVPMRFPSITLELGGDYRA